MFLCSPFHSFVLNSLTIFAEFYKFVFQFSREGTHKTIGAFEIMLFFLLPHHSVLYCPLSERDAVMALLPIVLDTARAPHLPDFLEFLAQCSHQRITLDQWDSFLQFQAAVKTDLSNFDEDGACEFAR